ncbi:MAG TPA: TrmH family RNA methyltransferase [Acidobacteriaceae bacterium]|nr:TrmH family RNA methyltransferase [Acidobacteriaceae bacterium]
MLTDEQRARVTVVLVRARNPNNIGAIARAMHGFGFSDLRLVNDYSVSLEQARSAIDASAILATAQRFATVADAIKDCNLVVGTTAVGERKLEIPLYTLVQCGEFIRPALSTGRVALLFGSEKTGLSNETLSYCNWLLTIPMHVTPGMRHASMNLGQAAAVCLYELIRDAKRAPVPDPEPMAQAEDLERATALTGEVLEQIGYTEHRPSSADPPALRRMVRRLNLSQSDARRWIGILRRLLWKLNE